MGRPRGNQRDGFTPSGDGKALDKEYASQDVPRFVEKHANPPYMRRDVIRRQKGAQGDA